jgi:hypothetical protein
MTALFGRFRASSYCQFSIGMTELCSFFNSVNSDPKKGLPITEQPKPKKSNQIKTTIMRSYEL